jgi:hypothetical protein
MPINDEHGERTTKELAFIGTALENLGHAIAESADDTSKKITHAIESALISPNEMDRNLKAANMVDGLFAIARGLDHIATALKDLYPKSPNEKEKETVKNIYATDQPDEWGETQWFDDHLNELFFYAQDQFEQHGRGAVILDMRQPEGKVLAYAPVASMPEEDIPETCRRVLEYDSATQVVVLIFGPDGRLKNCTVTGSRVPTEEN